MATTLFPLLTLTHEEGKSTRKDKRIATSVAEYNKYRYLLLADDSWRFRYYPLSLSEEFKTESWRFKHMFCVDEILATPISRNRVSHLITTYVVKMRLPN